MIRIVRVTNPIDPSQGQLVDEIELVGDSLWGLLVLHFERHDDGDMNGPDLHAWLNQVHVSVNGHVQSRSLWGEIYPKEGDTVVIAPVVEGGALVRTLASIAVIAVASAFTFGFAGAFAGFAMAWGGLGLSATASSLVAGAIGIAGNMLVGALLGPNQSNNKNASPSYDPDGPTSLAQSGTVIPKGYGTFMWGGNIISGFTEIAGSDQYVNRLVCYGFGPARSITDIQINGKPISEYQNTVFYTRLGSNDQTEIAQFNQIVNEYPQSTQCLAGIPVIVPGTGDLTQALYVDIQFPDGLFVDTNDGNLIPLVITYLLEYSVSGENNWQPVIVPQSVTPISRLNPNGTAYLPFAWGAVATDLPPNSNVVYYLDNGPHNPGDKYTAQEQVEVFAPNGNHYTYNKTVQGEWQRLDINSNYVAVNTWAAGYQDVVADQTTPYYWRSQILGLAPNKYDVRITKYGSTRLHDDVPPGDNWSSQVGQDMWVHGVSEITYLDLAYPNMILIGVRALSTSQLSGSGLKITATIEHGLRSKDEGLLPQELLAFEEDNPACVAADMFLDDLYGGGAWPGVTGANLAPYIDEWVSWAEMNDTLVPDGNGNSLRLHVFNGVMDNESDLWTQAGVVANMSRAAIVPVGQNYGVFVDQAVSSPVQMFHVGNILQDSFQESWLAIDDRANQVEVQFADRTRMYREDNPLVYMDPAFQDSGVIVKNTRIRAKGVTIPAQAFHFARYKERNNQFLLRTGSFRTDTDGIACRPGNVVALQHDVPQWGAGGRTLPGSTAAVLHIDRSDVAYAPGNVVMVQHPALLRFNGQVAAVAASTSPAGVELAVPNWTNPTRITRAILSAAPSAGAAAGYDCLVSLSAAGQIVVTPPPGVTPRVGQYIALWDTDVLETVPVAALAVTGDTAALTLGAPLSRAPEDYSGYIYGPPAALKLVRVTNISKASDFRSTIEYIDYDPEVYTIATPVVGETSAITTTDPAITDLLGAEIFQQVPGGTYVGYASLSWRNGPDTVGVAIYRAIVGGTGLAQMIARLPNATSFVTQQSAQSSITYTVVGYDAANNYASFTAAPSLTISATGITSNLLANSTFAGASFNSWTTTPRTGDSFQAAATGGGQAVYTVAGTPLTTAQAFATQTLDSSQWTVGDSLLFSGQVRDTCISAAAPNVGLAALNLIFISSSGAQTVTQATAPLNGTAPAFTSFQTAAAAIPAGTLSVQVQFGVGGTTQNLPVGSTVVFAQLMLEITTAGQTAASGYTGVNTQLLQGVGTLQQLSAGTKQGIEAVATLPGN